MPPKKSTTAAPKKAGSGPAHPSYQDMVKDAIIKLKERNGSSRQAIQKYIKANNTLGDISDNMFKSHVNRAISSGEKSGDFLRPKGASGTVKLAKKESAKPAAAKKTEKTEKKTTTATKAKKPAATKAKTTTTTTKKAAAPKKAAAAKPAAAKKTAAAKPKANASKPRKTAGSGAAPAVGDEKSTVLGKTKSGRVTKSKAPAAGAKKAAGTKKAPAKKAAATKKTTPKKATPKKVEA